METELKTLARMMASKKKMTMQEISQSLGLSRRQILYRIDKLNALLIGQKIQPIKADSVLSIDVEVRHELRRLCGSEEALPWEYSKEQRLLVLFLTVFCEGDRLALSDLISDMQTSRNTVLSDLRALGSRLKEDEVEISSSRQTGYTLSGSERNIRRAMMKMVMNAIVNERQAGVIDSFFEQHALGSYDYYRLVCQELALKHDLHFVEARMSEFIYIFMLLRTRLANHTSQETHLVRNAMTGQEYEFVMELLDFTGDLLWMSDADISALTSWILGISFGDIDEDTPDCLLISSMTGKILSRFELLSGTRPEQEETLFRQLYSHIRPAYYRLVYGIPICNPMTAKVISEYPDLYSLVQRAVRPAEKEAGYPFPQDEIAFLCMHFASLYCPKPAERQVSRRKSAMVLCHNGIGSSALLLVSLEEMFPALEFYGCTSSLKEVEFEQPDLLFVSSTMRAQPDLSIPVITVSPVMTSKEKQLVLREVNSILGMQAGIPTEEMILEVVRQHCKISDEQALRQELSGLFTSPVCKKRHIPLRFGQMMQPEFITCSVHAKDWQDAIRLSCQTLLEAGIITDQYIDYTIQSILIAGPYVVIAPHIALVHIRPDQGSLLPGMALTVLDEPVYFGQTENDPVDILFTLSTGPQNPASTDHFAAMSQLLTILEHPDFNESVHTLSPKALHTWMCLCQDGTVQPDLLA